MSPHAQVVPGWEGVSPGAQDVPGREGMSPHAQVVPGWEGVSPHAQVVPGWEGVSPAGRHRAARLRQAMTCVHSSRAARKSRTASWAAASEWFAPQPHWISLAAGTS